MNGIPEGVGRVKNRLFGTHDPEATLRLKSEDTAEPDSVSRNLTTLELIGEPPGNALHSEHTKYTLILLNHNLGEIVLPHKAQNTG